MDFRETVKEGVAGVTIVLCFVGAIFVGHCGAEASEVTLGDRAIEFMRSRPGGERRAQREATWIRELASWAIAVAGEWNEPSPSLLLAVSFRESSWKTTAIGALGERGLLQIHGRAARRVRREPLAEFRAGAHWMRLAIEQCSSVERGLFMYATGRCGAPTWRERLALRWARMMEE